MMAISHGNLHLVTPHKLGTQKTEMRDISPQEKDRLIAAVMMIVIGMPLSVALIGIPLVITGVWMATKTMINHSRNHRPVSPLFLGSALS